MTLLQLRKLFRKQSGRNDLVDANGADVGTSTHGLTATLLLNAGKDFLDEAFPLTPKSRKWYKKNLTVGQMLLRFQKARAIEEVWVANADGKAPLEYKSLTWMRTYYGKEKAEIDNGVPAFWTPATLGLSAEQAALTSTGTGVYTGQFTWDADDLLFANQVSNVNDYDGVLFYPPAEEIFTMSVLGLFGEKDLSANTDFNFWSTRYPLTLIFAACYLLEAFYRNKEGQSDWLAAIQNSLNGMDNNAVFAVMAQSAGSIAG